MAVAGTMNFILEDAEATKGLGREIARVLNAGDVLALCGELGAGKTTLTQGIAAGLGIPGDVLSPTFALMSEYRQGRIPLLHVDAYRLTGAVDADQLGLDEYLDEGWALVIEWPENIEGALPPDHLDVHLFHDGDRRRAEVRAGGPQSRIQLEVLRKRAGSGN
jgi:tRNA threonylcarbamoyladenosine biosynthesis protein TsaE